MIRHALLVCLSVSCFLACSDSSDPGSDALSDAELSKRRGNPNAGPPQAGVGGASGQIEGEPRAVEGNPSSCAAVIPGAAELLTFKVDPADSGIYTSSDGSLTVTIDASEKTFSFTSDVPLEWVIVKGGPGANIYSFSPPVTSAEGLVAPNGKGLSHLDFCYPPPGGGEGGSPGDGVGGSSSGGSSSGGTSSGGTSPGGTSSGGTNSGGSSSDGPTFGGFIGVGTGGCPEPCQR